MVNRLNRNNIFSRNVYAEKYLQRLCFGKLHMLVNLLLSHIDLVELNGAVGSFTNQQVVQCRHTFSSLTNGTGKKRKNIFVDRFQP